MNDKDGTTAISSEVASFDRLPLSQEVRRAIDDAGWSEPTPVQIQTYFPAVEGRDLIVQSRTGTGKTAAFGIPLVDRLVRREPGLQALILAPTRELALQSQRELDRLGAHVAVRTTAVYGGAGMERQVRELQQGAQIVSGTPGRVLDHLRRGTLDPSGLAVLVLDEADEMLSMGFAKELNAILELLPTKRQTLLFSATVDAPIQRVAERHMKEPTFVTLSGDDVGAQGISHFVYMVSGKGRSRDLVRVLEIENPESAIVFCNTKVETERVAADLRNAGFDADWLNGDLAQADREKVMARTRGGELRYLIATDVAARGIDVSHLTHVINYTLPQASEQYIHRTGRTGRAGRTGTAISLVSPHELSALYYLRLTYRIFPVERSLPTVGEERTRREADRLTMVEGLLSGEPAEIDRAVAQRLLTHPRAERLIAGLLATVFGARTDVDEVAAASRREKAPPPVEEVAVAAPARREKAPRATEGSAERRRPSREETRQPARARSEELAVAGDVAEGSDDGAESAPDEREHEATLYLNVGRRDGLRPGDINRLLCDEASLERSEIGKIRIRDRHSYVAVPRERLEGIVAALTGKSVAERELVVEAARR